MSFSRRQFIQASGVALCAGSFTFRTQAAEGQMALPVPPVLESRVGQPLFLTLQRIHWSFSGGMKKVPVWGINGIFPGPTVRVREGDDVKLIYSNRLNIPVAMTISGLQISTAFMGNAPRMIAPGTDWAPILPVRQPAATLWYHANTPHQMAAHVYNGLAGMWLIEDSISQRQPIPNHYGVDDFPLVIQDKRFDSFGVPVYNPPDGGVFMGDTLIVNGVRDPYITVSRGWVRLRLLNASSARRYQLSLSDKRLLMVIAGDLGFLPVPVAVAQLSLAPGERREVLIDMSQGGEVSIQAGTAASMIERLRGLFEPSMVLISTRVLTLRATGLLPLVTSKVPDRLLADQIPEGNISRSRELHLGEAAGEINSEQWDLRRIDPQPQPGTWERWIIHANTPQSFHLQGGMFLVKSVNGARPMAEDRGWKDTVWVDGDVELRVTFPQLFSIPIG